jgi:hypothetical protein
VEVEDDRNAGPQQADNMGRERRTQAFATLEIVGERLELRAIKLLNPAILADNQRSFA